MSNYLNPKRWMALVIVSALLVTGCAQETTGESIKRIKRMDEELDWIRYDQARLIYLNCQIREVSDNSACDGVVLPIEPESERPS